VGQSFQHLALAACACAVALGFAYTSATWQDKQLPPLGTPAGGKLAASEFNIGNRKFTRLGIDQPHGCSDDLASFSRVLGANAKPTTAVPRSRARHSGFSPPRPGTQS
jgi:hypothetical protein